LGMGSSASLALVNSHAGRQRKLPHTWIINARPAQDRHSCGLACWCYPAPCSLEIPASKESSCLHTQNAPHTGRSTGSHTARYLRTSYLDPHYTHVGEHHY